MLGASLLLYQDISEKHSQSSYPLNRTHKNEFLRFVSLMFHRCFQSNKYVFESLGHGNPHYIQILYYLSSSEVTFLLYSFIIYIFTKMS